MILYFPSLQEPRSQLRSFLQHTTENITLSALVFHSEKEGEGLYRDEISSVLGRKAFSLLFIQLVRWTCSLQVVKGLELACHLKKVIGISFNVCLPDKKKGLGVLLSQKTANSQLTAEFRWGHKQIRNSKPWEHMGGIKQKGLEEFYICNRTQPCQHHSWYPWLCPKSNTVIMA